MDAVVVVLMMLLAIVASGHLVRVLPFPLPLPLMQIALGALIALFSQHAVVLDPEIFFLLFLPPLLFLDGWRIPKDGLFRDKATILELALGLVLFTVIGLGLLIHWMIPAMPLPVAFALAAIVSPTDPVAVASIARRVPIPRRLLHILEGESLLNDATGLVCFSFAVAAATTGGFSLPAASLNFVWVSLGGILSGVVITLIIGVAQFLLARNLGEEAGSPILVNLLTPFGAYLAAEHLHASGILAAVAAGITMSYVELTGLALATTRVQRAVVWDAVQFALNGVVFVLLGQQLPGILRDAAISVEQSGHLNRWWLAAYVLAINLGLAVLRFIWVWASLRLTLLRVRAPGAAAPLARWRLVMVTSLAGARGAITLAGVMTLPLLLPDGRPFPARELAVFLAAAVILVSLVVASVGLPWMLQGLELPEEAPDQREHDHARRVAAVAAIAAIEQAQRHLTHETADAELYASAAARLIAAYQRRLDGVASGGVAASQVRRAEQAERALMLVGLQAEREEIFNLARQLRISDETSRRLVHEIDLLESRYH